MLIYLVRPELHRFLHRLIHRTHQDVLVFVRVLKYLSLRDDVCKSLLHFAGQLISSSQDIGHGVYSVAVVELVVLQFSLLKLEILFILAVSFEDLLFGDDWLLLRDELDFLQGGIILSYLRQVDVSKRLQAKDSLELKVGRLFPPLFVQHFGEEAFLELEIEQKMLVRDQIGPQLDDIPRELRPFEEMLDLAFEAIGLDINDFLDMLDQLPLSLL